jgi:hypothetical protein
MERDRPRADSESATGLGDPTVSRPLKRELDARPAGYVSPAEAEEARREGDSTASRSRRLNVNLMLSVIRIRVRYTLEHWLRWVQKDRSRRGRIHRQV